MMVLVFLAGIAGWSFVEYALHNWMFHLGGKSGASGWRRLLNNGFGRREHLHHHADPSYFSPWWMKLCFSSPVVLAVDLALWAVVPGRYAHAFALGFAAGWTAYEAFHYLAHLAAPRTRLGARLRKHHFHHHFVAPATNHGVTSMVWDRVFGTHAAAEQVPVPRKHAGALSWVLGADGGIAPSHAADYRLV